MDTSCSMKRWEGKVAVVTGASSGIGYAVAEKLVKLGVNVVGLARRKEKIDELASKLKGSKGKLFSCKMDITKDEDIINAFKWTKENVGPVSILINNAGVLVNTNLINGDITLWKKIFDTNVMGLCVATREAVNQMTENKIDGHIIHINSVAGHKVINFPSSSVYPASKFAVRALSETLYWELLNLKSKIKTTNLSPGAVATEIFATSGADMGELLKVIPFLSSEDIADALVFVLSTPPHVQISELTIKPVGADY